MWTSSFREEVGLFWGWGIWTLHWGGLFQCWASAVSSTRGSLTTAGTEHALQRLSQLTCLFKRRACQTSKNSRFGIFPLQLVRRCILASILESEKNYLDALKRILEVCNYSCRDCKIHLGSVISGHTVSFISNMRSPCPRLSRGCWATGNWRWPSIACVRSCSATSSSRLPWRAVWLSGTAWRWLGMFLWLR